MNQYRFVPATDLREGDEVVISSSRDDVQILRVEYAQAGCVSHLDDETLEVYLRGYVWDPQLDSWGASKEAWIPETLLVLLLRRSVEGR